MKSQRITTSSPTPSADNSLKPYILGAQPTTSSRPGSSPNRQEISRYLVLIKPPERGQIYTVHPDNMDWPIFSLLVGADNHVFGMDRPDLSPHLEQFKVLTNFIPYVEQDSFELFFWPKPLTLNDYSPLTIAQWQKVTKARSAWEIMEPVNEFDERRRQLFPNEVDWPDWRTLCELLVRSLVHLDKLGRLPTDSDYQF